MTCCEGLTSCNGFSLLILVLISVGLNMVPLISDYAQDGLLLHNSISCYEWWLPGIMGAGFLGLPAVAVSLAARKRGSCNSRTGMLFSSFLSSVSIIGASYCLVVSLHALSEGPLICNPNGNDLSNCVFSLKNLSNFQEQAFQLDWFFKGNCGLTIPDNFITNNDIMGLHRSKSSRSFGSDENEPKILHLSVFIGLFTTGVLEILFSISQIMVGIFGCICGTSAQRRSRMV
ncbi:transmembrane 4 L6 family member 20 [Ornithorhynchus anatinus]|uniref:Transmembrane 4 L six family member 20 n=1 Tax=Ornithorhynchus anatinus TaxID=9258 RepID=F6U9U6_ORNAN|nr:transmembrane 4 L6 family member 20 [Ornithorhynchus anatinus]